MIHRFNPLAVLGRLDGDVREKLLLSWSVFLVVTPMAALLASLGVDAIAVLAATLFVVSVTLGVRYRAFHKARSQPATQRGMPPARRLTKSVGTAGSVSPAMYPGSVILLVENNLDHAVLIQALLDHYRYGEEVFVTQSLDEAKSYLLAEWPFNDETTSPEPSLIILDQWLDDGTGLDLLEWLAQTPGLPDIPVMVFTACRDPKVQARAVELGVIEYFVKPEGFDALGKAIDAFLRPIIQKMRREEGDEAGSAEAS